MVQPAFNSLLHSNNWCANWLSSIEATGWLQHLRSILRAAHATATTIGVHGVPVLVHCSDGWDRTAQIASLTQILLDAHCRSINGFMALIDREWCAFGHCFRTRVAHGTRDSDRAAVQQSAPIFVQFLDCVFQIVRLQPTAFEFTSQLLVQIADAVYDCRFGNFMHDCERERATAAVEDRTPSLWVYLSANLQALRLANAEWEGDVATKATDVDGVMPTSSATGLLERLCPSALLRSVVLWDEYFVRYSTLPSVVPQQPVRCNEDAIVDDQSDAVPQQAEQEGVHEELRCQNAELLRQVGELQSRLSEIQAQSLVLQPPPPPSSSQDTIQRAASRSKGRKRPAEMDLEQEAGICHEGIMEPNESERVGTPRKKAKKSS
jgi:hypothetical protein